MNEISTNKIKESASNICSEIGIFKILKLFFYKLPDSCEILASPYTCLYSSSVILFRDFPVLTTSNKIWFIFPDLAISWWVLLTEQQSHWGSWEASGWSLLLIALSLLAAKFISLLVFLLQDRNNTSLGLTSAIVFDEIKHCKSFISLHLLPVSAWFRRAAEDSLGSRRDGETLGVLRSSLALEGWPVHHHSFPVCGFLAWPRFFCSHKPWGAGPVGSWVPQTCPCFPAHRWHFLHPPTAGGSRFPSPSFLVLHIRTWLKSWYPYLYRAVCFPFN